MERLATVSGDFDRILNVSSWFSSSYSKYSPSPTKISLRVDSISFARSPLKFTGNCAHSARMTEAEVPEYDHNLHEVSTLARTPCGHVV